MIVEPKIRGFICITAHPVGCAKHVQDQIDFVKAQTPLNSGPKKVVVIGASTGYGLASRITAAFGGSQASTIGVVFEKASDGKKTATAGWYNTVAFEQKAHAQGIYAKTFNGDAFSDEIKTQVINAIKNDWDGEVDMLIYSLASPRRQHPKTGVVSKSVLRPIGGEYTNTSIDMSKDQLETVTLPPATDEEIEQTVAVMGGEDWQMWIDAFEKEGIISNGFQTVAYSYMGPKLTQPVYRNGTIGRAKDHLEATSAQLDEKLKAKNGRAFISVNKALVTQSSSAIPFIPLYFVILKKIMVAKNIEEDCVQQIWRLFNERLLTGGDVPVDEKGFIRLDDLELREDVQEEAQRIWDNLSQENLSDSADLKGYHEDFLRLFGFGLDGVDYSADVDIELNLPSEEQITT